MIAIGLPKVEYNTALYLLQEREKISEELIQLQHSALSTQIYKYPGKRYRWVGRFSRY